MNAKFEADDEDDVEATLRIAQRQRALKVAFRSRALSTTPYVKGVSDSNYRSTTITVPLPDDRQRRSREAVGLDHGKSLLEMAQETRSNERRGEKEVEEKKKNE